MSEEMDKNDWNFSEIIAKKNQEIERLKEELEDSRNCTAQAQEGLRTCCADRAKDYGEIAKLKAELERVIDRRYRLTVLQSNDIARLINEKAELGAELEEVKKENKDLDDWVKGNLKIMKEQKEIISKSSSQIAELVKACKEAKVTYEGMDNLNDHSEYAFDKIKKALAPHKRREK